MAGCDLFIMPSRFEPCGLNQMYGLAYGTPPVVNATGGLADTVVDTNLISFKNKTANGFVMSEASSVSLLNAIKQALNVYKNDAAAWKQIQINGMNLDLTWDKSALAYLAAYQALLPSP
jgi:starch synthase